MGYGVFVDSHIAILHIAENIYVRNKKSVKI